MTALDALHVAYEAWRRTEPQLFWTDEVLFDGLDEPQPSALRFVEPAVAVASPEAGGLAVGAEPCCGTGSGLTAQSLHGPARIESDGSAPLYHYNAPVADPGQVQRDRGEEVTS